MDSHEQTGQRTESMANETYVDALPALVVGVTAIEDNRVILMIESNESTQFYYLNNVQVVEAAKNLLSAALDSLTPPVH